MAWLRARSIGARLLRTLITAVVGVLAVAMLVWEASIAPALRDAAGRHQLEVARRAADLIDEFIDRRVGELTRTLRIGLLPAETPDRQALALRRMLELSPTIEEVAIADADGRETLRLFRSRPFLPGDLRDIAETDRFRQARRGEAYVSDVYHALGAEPMITLAVPVRPTAASVSGVLTAEVSLRTLGDAIAHIRAGSTGHAFVVDRHGELVAHPDYSKVLTRGRDAYDPEVRALFERRPAGVTELAGQPAGGLVVSYTVNPRTGMTVVVQEPAATAFATLRRVERLGLVLLALGIGGAVLTTSWFSRRITRTLAELEEGAGVIARGNLGHSLRIKTGDELESLAQQFNHMAAQLRASYAALESEVVVKTLDLQALYAATTPISRAGDARGVLDEAVGKLIDVTGADAAAIELLGEPPVFVQRGFRGPLPAAVIPADVEIHDDLSVTGGRYRHLIEHGFASAAFVPLVMNGTASGLVTLAGRSTAQLPSRSRELMRAIGHQIAVAVENARLYAESQRAMRELKEKNAELDTFVYSVSHDLKAPLVTIHGMAGVLLDEAIDRLDDKHRHYLARIDANCTHMQSLILHLLALSRIGRDAWTPEDVPLNDVVDAVLADLRADVDARGVTLTVDALPVVRAPRVHMEEVLRNLLSNAVKYLGPTPEPVVAVGARAHGDHVEVWVRDNGIGIDPAYQGRVFEAFQRLKDVKAEGSGVGLAIVKKIVETAGGRVWVESARGAGATFHFTWPTPTEEDRAREAGTDRSTWGAQGAPSLPLATAAE
jgi:signal transduction histidine kinase